MSETRASFTEKDLYNFITANVSRPAQQHDECASIAFRALELITDPSDRTEEGFEEWNTFSALADALFEALYDYSEALVARETREHSNHVQAALPTWSYRLLELWHRNQSVVSEYERRNSAFFRGQISDRLGDEDPDA